MHRSTLKPLAAVLVAALSFASSASAAGLLGQRHAALSYDHTFVETGAYDDGGGLSLFYNHPLLETVDLSFVYRYTSWDGARDDVGDFSEHRFLAHMTAFGGGERDVLFARVGVGVGHVESGSRDVTGLAWSGVAGTEYALNEKAVLQPYFGWNDVINDGRRPRFIYGLLVAWDASEGFGLTARIEGDSKYNVVLSVGALVRF